MHQKWKQHLCRWCVYGKLLPFIYSWTIIATFRTVAVNMFWIIYIFMMMVSKVLQWCNFLVLKPLELAFLDLDLVPRQLFDVSPSYLTFTIVIFKFLVHRLQDFYEWKVSPLKPFHECFAICTIYWYYANNQAKCVIFVSNSNQRKLLLFVS